MEMSNNVNSKGESLEHGRSIVFRNGIVITMDNAHRVLKDCDVLVVDGVIKEIGPNLTAPDDALSIDAAGGIVMPGMIDTHRHMWQTAMRAYGADWTLTQYFVWYYLQHGKNFRPEDIYAGNLLSAIEAVDAGVTTSVDWSHGLQTAQHADAAVDALEAVPGRFVLAYGNIQQAPWEWSVDPAFKEFYRRRFDGKGDMLGFQMAFDVLGDPGFPEKAAFDVAKELGVAVTTHAGVLGATGDDSIRLMHENGCMGPDTVFVHCATLSADSYNRIAASGGVPARVTPRRGNFASTTFRSRCRRTPRSGGAPTSSPRCAPPSVRTGPVSTWRPTRRANR
jgi:5-methylthioadenosine/S-adenosylhomocysteine deaminase